MFARAPVMRREPSLAIPRACQAACSATTRCSSRQTCSSRALHSERRSPRSRGIFFAFAARSAWSACDRGRRDRHHAADARAPHSSADRAHAPRADPTHAPRTRQPSDLQLARRRERPVRLRRGCDPAASMTMLSGYGPAGLRWRPRRCRRGRVEPLGVSGLLGGVLRCPVGAAVQPHPIFSRRLIGPPAVQR